MIRAANGQINPWTGTGIKIHGQALAPFRCAVVRSGRHGSGRHGSGRHGQAFALFSLLSFLPLLLRIIPRYDKAVSPPE
jgi:hypothetical protein